MHVQQSWADNWNDIYCTKLYGDTELKDMMLIPSNNYNKLAVFRDRYFVKGATADELVKDEKVRIIYYEEKGYKFGNHKVNLKYMTFDIYVKQDCQYTVDSEDGMRSRPEMIAQKLKEILVPGNHQSKYVCRMRFDFVDSYDMPTKVVGYTRYHVIFSYKITI